MHDELGWSKQAMNKKEYIEREAALSAQNKSMNLSEMRKRLERIPAADVRPVVRGKWISEYPLSTCSVCEKSMILCDFANYCPNCGADMRGSNNEQAC